MITLKDFYQKKDLLDQRERFEKLADQLKKKYKLNSKTWFSAPGRSEICGNHTDHNNGLVIAASIHLDTIAVAAPNFSDKIQVTSEGFEPVTIDLNSLAPSKKERETSQSLIRGIAAYLKQKGYRIGGFSACISSQVLAGSGLSSSASFETLIASILNHFFNNSMIDPLEMALAGQFAENQFFGKPCGLMDQLTCILGGILKIDFENNLHPKIERINFSFEQTDYRLMIVNTGKSHADLTEEYASIPAEMKQIARFFNKESLRSVDPKEFKKKIPQISKEYQERPLLRGMHYFAENQRVIKLFKALKKRDLGQGLALIKESGDSSFKLLQNIYSNKNPLSQPLSIALAVSEEFFQKIGKGVCRVHGGGFGGTIQSLVPVKNLEDYVSLMENLLYKNCCTELKIRDKGLIIFRDP